MNQYCIRPPANLNFYPRWFQKHISVTIRGCEEDKEGLACTDMHAQASRLPKTQNREDQITTLLEGVWCHSLLRMPVLRYNFTCQIIVASVLMFQIAHIKPWTEMIPWNAVGKWSHLCGRSVAFSEDKQRRCVMLVSRQSVCLIRTVNSWEIRLYTQWRRTNSHTEDKLKLMYS